MLDTSDDALFERWAVAATDATFQEWCAEKDRPRDPVSSFLNRERQRKISSLMLPGSVVYVDCTFERSR